MKKENAETEKSGAVWVEVSLRHRVLCVAAPAVFFCALLTADASTNYGVSRPVGVVRIAIGGGEQKLVAMPFKPLDPAINAVLSGLSGSTNEANADAILKWDAVLLSYIRALKADGTGNPDIDGKWFADFESLIPTDMTLEPGEGFFLWNKQGTNQAVFLAGEVMLAESNRVMLLPSLNLVGYPYSTSMKASETSLAGATNSEFVIGKGYWHDVSGTGACVWTEVRPYADEFPQGDEPPLITGMQVKDGSAVTLTIACEGAAGEKLDIFYQDLSPSGRLDTVSGWTLAESDIAVKGRKQIEWTDQGDASRSPVNEVFARYYLVGRADVAADADGDGLSDVREKFLKERGKGSTPAAGSVGTADAAAMGGAGTGSVSQADSASASARASGEKTVTPVVGRVIYVDQAIGSDQYSGRTAVAAEGDGPKKTIKAGLGTAAAGDTVIIKSGNYDEHIYLADLPVSVLIEGQVDTTGRRAADPVPAAPAPAPAALIAVTNGLPGNSETNSVP